VETLAPKKCGAAEMLFEVFTELGVKRSFIGQGLPLTLFSFLMTDAVAC
jgi:hypothetical protein